MSRHAQGHAKQTRCSSRPSFHLRSYALIHGHNPFVTSAFNYPMGANMMDNTFMPLIGVLAAPITFTAGPGVTFNVIVVAAFAGSALSAFFVLRRWTAWLPAAYVGGLLYGFSPYMASQGLAHIDLLMVPIPPLVLLVLDGNSGPSGADSALRYGITLGLLLTAQLLVAPEVLATTALMAAIGIVLLVVFRWRFVVARLRHALRAVIVAGGTFGVLSVYPIWVYLFGPDHVVGAAQPRGSLNVLSSDLLSVVVPSQVQRISPSAAQRVMDVIAPPSVWGAENGAYIGIPLFVILVILVVRSRRRGIVQFCAAMTMVALVLSLGPTLRVDGHDTGFPLPFRIASALPFMESIVAARFSLFVGLFSAVLLAVGLDQLQQSGWWRVRAGRQGAVAAALVAAVGLVPLIPAWPYTDTPIPVPHFFESGLERSIPQGSALLTYPFPDYPYSLPMYWQALDGFRFNLPGGYLYTRTTSGGATLDGSPSVTGSLLESCQHNGDPQATPSQRAAMIRGSSSMGRVDGGGHPDRSGPPVCGLSPERRTHEGTPIGFWRMGLGGCAIRSRRRCLPLNYRCAISRETAVLLHS